MRATDAIRAALQLSYDWNRSLAQDMRDAPMTFPTPNGGNHPVWVVGHAVHSRAGLMSMITGEPSSFFEQWKSVLGGGSQPVADRSSYPDYDELLDVWEQQRKQINLFLDSVSEEDLDRPPAAVPAAAKDDPDFSTVGRLLIFIALHEMSHRGQLADARRAAGRSVLAI